MRLSPVLGFLLALACADAASAASRRQILAMGRPETRTEVTLSVTSPAFASGGTIDLRYTPIGAGRSPALSWSRVPAGTKSLVLIMEDSDAGTAKVLVHWLVWNVDPALPGLAENIVPAGARQGRNGRGASAYLGPHPRRSKAHHYHFQLFALDRVLDLPAGANRENLLAAMNGHVLAKGDLIGLFRAPRTVTTASLSSPGRS